jgi:hypothetical protein
MGLCPDRHYSFVDHLFYLIRTMAHRAFGQSIRNLSDEPKSKLYESTA